MNLHHQIRTYRNSLQISQEDLAENIYVSRQTISNWETGKSYPDIHSLLLLSKFFGISLDELVKGDLEIMEKKIGLMESKRVRGLFNVFTLLFLIMVVSIAPLLFFFKTIGMILWVFIATITMLVSIKVEKFKKANDIQTYKEIAAFMKGETLDKITKEREIGKRNYQKLILALGSAIITLITVWLFIMVLELLLN